MEGGLVDNHLPWDGIVHEIDPTDKEVCIFRVGRVLSMYGKNVLIPDAGIANLAASKLGGVWTLPRKYFAVKGIVEVMYCYDAFQVKKRSSAQWDIIIHRVLGIYRSHCEEEWEEIKRLESMYNVVYKNSQRRS